MFSTSKRRDRLEKSLDARTVPTGAEFFALHYSVTATFISLWNFVLCLFKISYIKSKVTRDHSETINLFSMWNKANDATYTHKFYLQDNMF